VTSSESVFGSARDIFKIEPMAKASWLGTLDCVFLFQYGVMALWKRVHLAIGRAFRLEKQVPKLNQFAVSLFEHAVFLGTKFS